MFLWRIVFLSLLLSAISVADSATQTDWSGGPGVQGPVGGFGNHFLECSEAVGWAQNPGSASIEYVTEHSIDVDWQWAQSVHLDDIDGDGDVDALGAASSRILWWENQDGSGTTWIEHTIKEGFNGACCVLSMDMDGDGDLDVLGGAYSDDILWWENLTGSGDSWEEHLITDDVYCVECVYSSDMDADGDYDVVYGTWTEGESGDEVAWWENMDGQGTIWSKQVIDGSLISLTCVFSSDIDGDGDMDVLASACNSSLVVWWENADGSGSSWNENIVGSATWAAWVTSADLDGDMDQDIISAESGELSWWENEDGVGTAWTKRTLSGSNGAACVHTCDIDEDGDQDVFGVLNSGDVVCWWENVGGSGTLWSEHTIRTDIISPMSIDTGDINGDGDLDVAVAAYGNTYGWEMTWWEIHDGTDSGELVSSILYLGGDPHWGLLDWSSNEPSGTSLSFQVRASDDPGSMGAWSDNLSSPCDLSGILSDNDSYIQYKALFLSESIERVVPVLEEVTVTWDPLGIDEGQQFTEFVLRGAEVNPSRDPVRIAFELPAAAIVELSVYDLSGRIVVGNLQGEYPEGAHQVQVSDLAPGIYLCRMVAGEYVGIQRFVVID